MSDQRCGTCDFFDAAYGECRRHAPVVTVLRSGEYDGHGRMIGQHVTAWPDVEPDQWCGEYRHTPEATDV